MNRTMFADVLARVLAAAFLRAGAAIPDLAGPWIEVAARAGPVSRRGPLTHDVLVPVAGRPPAVGLTVFGHDASLRVIAVAEVWAAEHLGNDAARTVAELARLPALWHAGFSWTPAGHRLKLYATEGAGAVARALGRQPAGVGCGIDVVRGIERFRTYHEGGDAGVPWPPLSPGVSHRIVTVLEGVKRTANTIFRPGAPLAALAEVAAAGPPGVPLEWLAEIDRGLPRPFRLRPVAHEIDVYDDRVEVDALVAVGSDDVPR